MDVKLEKRLRRAARALKKAGANEVYVFGSAAEDNLSAESDIDLAVSGLPPSVFFRAMGRASDALGLPVDLVDLDEDNRFVSYLKEKGKLLRVV